MSAHTIGLYPHLVRNILATFEEFGRLPKAEVCMKKSEQSSRVSGAVSDRILERSSLYQEFLAEREEILRHKWIESEKAGCDVGFERALLDWIRNHRDDWRAARRGKLPHPQTPVDSNAR